MTVKKLSVSFEAELTDLIRETAAIEGVSVSAWLAEAASDRVRNRRLGLALDAAESEDGPMRSEEMTRLVAAARENNVVVAGSPSSSA